MLLAFITNVLHSANIQKRAYNGTKEWTKSQRHMHIAYINGTIAPELYEQNTEKKKLWKQNTNGEMYWARKKRMKKKTIKRRKMNIQMQRMPRNIADIKRYYRLYHFSAWLLHSISSTMSAYPAIWRCQMLVSV